MKFKREKSHDKYENLVGSLSVVFGIQHYRFGEEWKEVVEDKIKRTLESMQSLLKAGVVNKELGDTTLSLI